jgi:hypothetical protein
LKSSLGLLFLAGFRFAVFSLFGMPQLSQRAGASAELFCNSAAFLLSKSEAAEFLDRETLRYPLSI